MRRTRKSSVQSETVSFLSQSISIIKYSIIAIIISLICFILFAVIMKLGGMDESIIPPVIQVIRVLSVAIGGAMAARACYGKGWLMGAATGIVYMLFAVIISMLFGGGITLNTVFLSDLALGFIAGAVGGIIGINLKQ